MDTLDVTVWLPGRAYGRSRAFRQHAATRQDVAPLAYSLVPSPRRWVFVTSTSLAASNGVNWQYVGRTRKRHQGCSARITLILLTATRVRLRRYGHWPPRILASDSIRL